MSTQKTNNKVMTNNKVIDKKATVDELSDLHGLFAKALKEKLLSGNATAAELNVIRTFLKDNNIESIPTPTNPMGHLTEALKGVSLPFSANPKPTDGGVTGFINLQ